MVVTVCGGGGGEMYVLVAMRQWWCNLKMITAFVIYIVEYIVCKLVELFMDKYCTCTLATCTAW